MPHNPPGVMCSAPASYMYTEQMLVLLPLWSILLNPNTYKPLSAGTVAVEQSTLCLTPMSPLDILKGFFPLLPHVPV